MKIKLKNKTGLTFGDFVAAVYQNCGARRAANFVQLAIHSRQVVLQKQPTEQPSGLLGRIKIRPGIALLAVLLGCAGFVNAGYSQVIVRPPQIEVVVPAPVFVPPPVVIEPDLGSFFSAVDTTDGITAEEMRVILDVAVLKAAAGTIMTVAGESGSRKT